MTYKSKKESKEIIEAHKLYRRSKGKQGKRGNLTKIDFTCDSSLTYSDIKGSYYISSNTKYGVSEAWFNKQRRKSIERKESKRLCDKRRYKRNKANKLLINRNYQLNKKRKKQPLLIMSVILVSLFGVLICLKQGGK